MEIQMNKRTADYIADQLADQILSGAIRGGTPLKQEELSGLLGASRIPVREALQIIEHQGLAVRLATRHVVTADFSDAHIREIYGIIGDIERRVLCDLAASEQQGENPGIFVEETLTELEFHRRIYGMTDNAYVRNILKNAVECYVRFAISPAAAGNGKRRCRVTAKDGMAGRLLAETGSKKQTAQCRRTARGGSADGAVL